MNAPTTPASPTSAKPRPTMFGLDMTIFCEGVLAFGWRFVEKMEALYGIKLADAPNYVPPPAVSPDGGEPADPQPSPGVLLLREWLDGREIVPVAERNAAGVLAHLLASPERGAEGEALARQLHEHCLHTEWYQDLIRSPRFQHAFLNTYAAVERMAVQQDGNGHAKPGAFASMVQETRNRRDAFKEFFGVKIRKAGGRGLSTLDHAEDDSSMFD